ncbi:hypothetical protein [Ideonella sp.]|uniref:hypothetical protein n=1 Tax=Ideonella sp. TaxID=1929293 RepID=UPI0035B4A9C0
MSRLAKIFALMLAVHGVAVGGEREALLLELKTATNAANIAVDGDSCRFTSNAQRVWTCKLSGFDEEAAQPALSANGWIYGGKENLKEWFVTTGVTHTFRKPHLLLQFYCRQNSVIASIVADMQWTR